MSQNNSSEQGGSPSRLYSGLEAPAPNAQTPRKDVTILSQIPSTADFYGLTGSPTAGTTTSAQKATLTTTPHNREKSEDAITSLKQPLLDLMKEIPDNAIWASSQTNGGGVGNVPSTEVHSGSKDGRQPTSLLPGVGDALVGSVLSDMNQELKLQGGEQRRNLPSAIGTRALSSNSSLASNAEDLMEYENLQVDAQGNKLPVDERDVRAFHTFVTMEELLQNNRRWAKAMVSIKPDFFHRLAQQQAPPILWIGCSDSRVPANQILALEPGQVFVHRNIGNVVVHTDLNCTSVLQLAVDVLKVSHVIVCGHYGCSGVWCSMQNRQYGQVDCWLRHIKDIYHQHRSQLENVAEGPARADLLCELNVAHSVRNVCASSVIQNAWDRGQALQVHGWCYRLTDGIIRDLKICVKSREDLPSIYRVLDNKAKAEE